MVKLQETSKDKPFLLPTFTHVVSKGETGGGGMHGFIHPICIMPCVGVHLTDGHPDLNYNQVIQ